jgi:DNA-binding NtrC family response regulator
LIREIAARHPQLPVIVMTGNDDLKTAVECMQSGAVDYLVKPVDPERLAAAVRRSREMRELREEVVVLRQAALVQTPLRHPAFAEILTGSAEMLRIFQYLEAVSRSAHPVLIMGESGTGKDLLARAMHRISGRNGPCVEVNVAGLDDALFSDTLFGHMRGAFNDAVRDRGGLVLEAADGTLFLDEIGDLSLASQVKLLRLLQNGTFYPLGSDKPQRSRARIITATNRDVFKDVESGKFRADLYYRLDHQVQLPPLRARRSDIPLLVTRFLDDAAVELGRPMPSVPRELFQLLGAYHFPGNVRELKRMCVDALAQHAGGTLSLASFREKFAPDRARSDVQGPSAPDTTWSGLLSNLEPLPTLCESEEALINEAMRRSGGNQTVAAGLLGIFRQALNRRLVKRRPPA